MPLATRMEIRPDSATETSPAQPLSVVAAFVGVALIGVASSVLPLGSQTPEEMAVLLGAVVLCATLFGFAMRRRGQPSVLHLLAPLSFLPVVAVTREILNTPSSGTASMVLLPVLWLALTGTPRQLVIAGACSVLTLALPIVLVGPPTYPTGEWRRVATTAAIITLIVPLVQRLVRRLSFERIRAESTVGHLDGIMRGTSLTTMVSCNLDGTIRFFNVGAENLLGMTRQDAVGQLSMVSLHDPDELSDLATEFGVDTPLEALAALAHSDQPNRTFRYQRAGGGSVTVRLTLSVLRGDNGAPSGYLAVGHDMTDEMEASRALEEANNQFRRLFTDAPHGVAVLDPAGTVLLMNRALRGILGLSHEAVQGASFAQFGPGDRTIRRHLHEVLTVRGQSVETDCVLVNQRGVEVHVALSSRYIEQEHDPGDVIFVNVVDVSERRRYQEQLSHLVDHDVLTGLANRRRFDTELGSRLAGHRLHGTQGALILLDLDHFKQVNDTLGHDAGDQLLVQVARVLEATVRRSDLVARTGGDEFAIVLDGVDRAGAEAVAAAVVEAVAELATGLVGVRRRVRASAGVVTFRAATEQNADLLALADMTMYDAKEAGRNRYAVLPEGGGNLPRMGVQLEWQRRIEEALEQDRFVLLYQPVVDVGTGRTVSAEVLLRMLGDDGARISPARFLSTAERVGLMPSVDTWVVNKAVATLPQLRAVRPGFAIGVNLSGQSLGDPGVESAIVAAVAQHGVQPGELVLEVTETVAVQDVSLARDFADRMTQAGCRFALDDFGAGFGSFHYLKHLAFDYVKIDGEFVATMADSEIDRTIVASMVRITHDLGKRAIAEYVADAEVLRLVTEAGVDLAQGFHLGMPVPLDEFLAGLRSADRQEV
ncbi:MAG: EAL domain-containing protein [Nocardioides sp.]|uniref:EAL domain-containing protein n=1 Tax=Nocardioides sp. TaxID=35761 RepID=UPI003F0603B2